MFPHPGEHLLDVDQVIGEVCGRAQSVVRADAQPPLTREPVDKRKRLAVLLAADQRSPVQVHQHGAARGLGAMTVDIKQVFLTGIAIADVRHPDDITTLKEERRK